MKLSRIVIDGVALIAAALIVPGVKLAWKTDPTQTLITLLVLAFVFGVINAYIRPVLRAVSLPVNLLSMGLFSFFLNAGPAAAARVGGGQDLGSRCSHIGGFPPHLSAETLTRRGRRIAGHHGGVHAPVGAAARWLSASASRPARPTSRSSASAVRSGSATGSIVSGTGPIWPDGTVDPDPEVQADTMPGRSSSAALAAAGADAADVVRTRMFLVDADDWEAVGRAHGAGLRRHPTRRDDGRRGRAPRSDRWRVEIEAEAIIEPDAAATPR